MIIREVVLPREGDGGDYEHSDDDEAKGEEKRQANQEVGRT